MRTYQITVILADALNKVALRFTGIFEDGFAACIQYMDDFPEAQRISVRRLS